MSAPPHIRNIALIGFMGAGKSSVGRLVAAQLGFEFVDTDELIEARAGRRISEIFREEGETVFRGLEREAVAELAARQNTVIATGGGLAARPDNLASLKSHAFVVCLWASPDIIWERVQHQTHRPLLQGADSLGRIRQLLAEREPFYRQADLLLNTGQRSIRQVVQHLIRQFRLIQHESASS